MGLELKEMSKAVEAAAALRTYTWGCLSSGGGGGERGYFFPALFPRSFLATHSFLFPPFPPFPRFLAVAQELESQTDTDRPHIPQIFPAELGPTLNFVNKIIQCIAEILMPLYIFNFGLYARLCAGIMGLVRLRHTRSKKEGEGEYPRERLFPLPYMSEERKTLPPPLIASQC